MDVDLSALTIATTKPDRKPAMMLAKKGIKILPVEEDEGNVDRYIISKRLVIERRTDSSFLRGIMEKTLFTSAIYLREHFSIPILIVEGEVNYEYTMFDPQAIRGALSSMMLQYGLNVLSAKNLEETVELIAMMARQEQIGIPEISLIPKRKATGLADMQRRVIEMLPQCGMVMARDLLQHFGSVRRIMNATANEFLSLRGIGEKKVADILKVLNAEYEAVDTEKHLEDAIEIDPSILFDRPVTFLARQHHIYTEEKERHIIDMVFLDSEAGELILVELKRGRLTGEHYNQLLRYLSNADKSRMLREYLEKGMALRGVLATMEPCKFKSKDAMIEIRFADKPRAIAVLKQLRDRRLKEMRKPKVI